MMYAVPVAIVVLTILLGLASFVQLLYLESVRLRSRDLDALSFFKETLEDRIGFENEIGATCFSVVKHTSILLLGLLYLVLLDNFAEALAMAWLTMMTAAYAMPQLLYRRSRAEWL